MVSSRTECSSTAQSGAPERSQALSTALSSALTCCPLPEAKSNGLEPYRVLSTAKRSALTCSLLPEAKSNALERTQVLSTAPEHAQVLSIPKIRAHELAQVPPLPGAGPSIMRLFRAGASSQARVL